MGKGNARDWQTRVRLWAAIAIGCNQLVVMTYYSLGLVSGEAMEAFMSALGPYWSLGPVFTTALFIHLSLGLWKLFHRNTLKMPVWEAFQIGLGLLLPFILLPYAFASLATTLVFHLQLNYVDTVLLSFPDMAWRYVALTLIVGAHAQIGTHAVLRMRPWYPRVRLSVIVIFVLLPLMAALGYLKSGFELYQSYQAGGLSSEDLPHLLTVEQKDFLSTVDLWDYGFFLGVYALLFLGRGLRLAVEERKRTIRINYPSGYVMVLPATTILEASRIGGIPHASICGGRGRCTTCRIRVEEGIENLSAVGERESKALSRIGAASDIRLACQAEGRQGTIKVTPLLPPDVRSVEARHETKDTVGRDVALAVMFADIRGFTGLSEQKFPYDVVYILNSYFKAMGEAITTNGGRVDKFLGDGLLAYFGLDQDPRDGCLNAIKAVQKMAQVLLEVNKRLEHVLPHGLTIGVGLHFGDVILGEIGFQDRAQLTIIGDTVNTASRLEAMNKESESQLILSTTLAAKAGLDLSHLPVVQVALRGRTDSLRVYIVKDILKDLG